MRAVLSLLCLGGAGRGGEAEVAPCVCPPFHSVFGRLRAAVGWEDREVREGVEGASGRDSGHGRHPVSPHPPYSHRMEKKGYLGFFFFFFFFDINK